MNTKIIDFADAVLKANEQEKDRDAIFDVVVIPAVEEIIKEAGLVPMKFVVLDSSLQSFMERPITY